VQISSWYPGGKVIILCWDLQEVRLRKNKVINYGTGGRLNTTNKL
jgi:hypothetical protein